MKETSMSESWRRRKFPGWVIGGAFGLVLAAAGGWGVKGALFPSVGSTRIGDVKRKDLVQRVTSAGIVIPHRRTVIIAPYNGYLRKLYVQIGQKVKAGEPIVVVTESLTDSLTQAYPLRAPFAGTVVQVLHTEGEYVSSTGNDSTLVRIDDLSHLGIVADIPEMEIPNIKEGQQAILRISAVLSKTYRGVIREISRAARETGQWNRPTDKADFPIQIEITDADAEIKPGMSAIVDIITAKHVKTLTLPHEFIQQTGDKYFVVLESGKKREIKIGLANEDEIEITSGLKEGDRVRQTDFLELPDDYEHD